MYSLEYQEVLLNSLLIKNYICENFQHINKSAIVNKSAYSVAIFVDIFGFSNRMSGRTPESISDYLFKYYQKALPIIQKHKGRIDRIAGDGIVAVFSEILENNDYISDSFICATELVEKFSKYKDYQLKVGIGEGELFYCSIGNINIYEEVTVVGTPLTIAYRLEDNAIAANQILLMKNSIIAQKIKYGDNIKPLAGWDKEEIKLKLKGIPDTDVIKLNYDEIKYKNSDLCFIY